MSYEVVHKVSCDLCPNEGRPADTKTNRPKGWFQVVITGDSVCEAFDVCNHCLSVTPLSKEKAKNVFQRLFEKIGKRH